MTPLLVLCPITDDMRTRLAQRFAVTVAADIPDMQAWLTQAGAEVPCVLTDGHIGVPADVLAGLPELAFISCYGVGYDGIDMAAVTARGIPVSHTPGVLNDEVATTAVLLYLACWRNLEQQMAQARSGRWATAGGLPLARSADGRTVGILGLGRIGQAIATKLQAFGAMILYHGRSPKNVPYTFEPDLTEMARKVDCLISVVPGDASTRHMINADVIRAIGPAGYLVNVGRGSTVDETALIAALEAGEIAGAGLDVFEAEPKIPAALRALPNVVLTPHIGSATVETRQAMGNLAIDNLFAWDAAAPLLTPVPESQALLSRSRAMPPTR